MSNVFNTMKMQLIFKVYKKQLLDIINYFKSRAWMDLDWPLLKPKLCMADLAGLLLYLSCDSDFLSSHWLPWLLYMSCDCDFLVVLIGYHGYLPVL